MCMCVYVNIYVCICAYIYYIYILWCFLAIKVFVYEQRLLISTRVDDFDPETNLEGYEGAGGYIEI